MTFKRQKKSTSILRLATLPMLVAFLSVACNTALVMDKRGNDTASKEGEPEKDDEETRENQPSSVAGTNLLGYDSARARCRFVAGENRRFHVGCDAVDVGDDGNEYKAYGKEPGVSIEWKLPQRINGSEIVAARCQAQLMGLEYNCDIELADATSSKVEFSFEVALAGKKRKEADVLRLPYSVTTYGFVMQAPRSYEIGGPKNESAALALGAGQKQKLGFQTEGVPALGTSFSNIASMCRRGKRLFFSSMQHIYVYENGLVQLYAGSANLGNQNNFDHRYYHNFRKTPAISCKEGSVYAIDGGTTAGQVLELFDDGRISVIRNPRSHENPTGGLGEFADLIYLNKSTGKDGEIYYSPYRAFYVDGSEYHVVKKKVGNVETNFAGATAPPYSLDGGPAIQAQLYGPSAIATDKIGNVFIYERNSYNIRKVNAAGIISTFANISQAFYSVDRPSYKISYNFNKPLILPDFPNQFDMVADDDGGLMLSVFSFGRIIYIDKNGEVRPLVGKFDDEETSSATQSIDLSDPTNRYVFDDISATAVARDGAIYIAHTGRSIIQKLDVSGKLTLVTADVKYPQGLALDQDDSLFIADTGNNRILQISPSGTTTLIAGGANPNTTVSGDMGVSPIGFPLDSPKKLAYHVPTKTLYILTAAHLFKIDSAEKLYRVAGRSDSNGGSIPVNNPVGDLGPAVLAYLNNPQGLALDSDGNIFMSDTGNNIIRMIRSDGTIKTIAGGAGAVSGPSIDDRYPIDVDTNTPAFGSAIKTFFPQELLVEANGDILYTDTEASRVRLLKKGTVANGEVYYTPVAIIGGTASNPSCGNNVLVKGSAPKEEIKDALKANIAVACVGRPKTIARSQISCNPVTKTRTTVISQYFDFNNPSSNILKIIEPCDAN